MPIEACRKKFERTLKAILITFAVLGPLATMQACRNARRAEPYHDKFDNEPIEVHAAAIESGEDLGPPVPTADQEFLDRGAATVKKMHADVNAEVAPCGTKYVRASGFNGQQRGRLLTGAELRKLDPEHAVGCTDMIDGLECPCVAAEDCSNKTEACDGR